MNRKRMGCYLGLLLALAGSQALSQETSSPPSINPAFVQAQDKPKTQDKSKIEAPKSTPKTEPATQDKTKTPPPPAPTRPQLPLPTDLAAAAPTPSSLTAGLNLSQTYEHRMLGDLLGIPAIAFGRRGVVRVPGQVTSAVVVPSARSFKISENESPQPQDRAYIAYNHFDSLNEDVNNRFRADLHDIAADRFFFGFEKTFMDGDVSLGMRLPLNSLSADSPVPGFGGSSTALGDLSIIGKMTVLANRETGDILSAGMALSIPTGPDSFAGFDQIETPHYTVFHPFAGYRLVWEKIFIHGFLAFDFPTSTSNDVTMMTNDIGIGYFLYRNNQQDGGPFLTAITPTFEIHVNTPLNHRGAFDEFDLVGTPDMVNLTFGTTFEFNRRSTFALGFVTPITGPRPFDWEVLAQFNYSFGARSASRTAPTMQ